MAENPAVAFLLAAHQRAEEVARAIPGGPWMLVHINTPGVAYQSLEGPTGVPVLRSTTPAGGRSSLERHPAFDEFLPEPAAVLRRVAAERQILAEHQSTTELGYAGADYVELDRACTCCGTADEYGTPWPCRTVLLLAEAWGWTEGAS